MLGSSGKADMLAVIHFSAAAPDAARSAGQQCQMTGSKIDASFSTNVRRRLSGAFQHAAVRPCLKLHARKKFLHQSFTKLLLMGLWKAGIIALRQIH